MSFEYRTNTHIKPHQIDDKLSEFGLRPDLLLEAAKAAHQAYINRTPYDPPIHPGINAWGQSVRILRQGLLPLGWRKDDAGNYSRTISDKAKINIVVASGDAATGTPSTPSTKSVKGTKTELAIDNNSYQIDFLEELLPVDIKLAAQSAEYNTWIFLFHVSDDFVRCEMSLPAEITKGHITQWHERILLPEIKFDSDPWSNDFEDENSDEKDIDVAVTRRKQ